MIGESEEAVWLPINPSIRGDKQNINHQQGTEAVVFQELPAGSGKSSSEQRER